jgi:DNA-binding transcriptional LysR family regulator
MKPNLRHLRVFQGVTRTGSITRTAEIARVSQSAVTQIVAKLEAETAQPLFLRRPQGLFPTEAGTTLSRRIDRALSFLDPALAALEPRLTLTATYAQIQALIALTEAENFTLAARRLGLAQPTIHRAITVLEEEAGRPLFERTAHGVLPVRATLALAEAAQLAFAELDQAESDLADLIGREVGRIVIGAMPLSRSHLLPRAIARFRTRRPTLAVRALDGPYDDMMAGLRRGEVDFLIGALRDPAPIGDVEQLRLFDDTLVMVARPDHPLCRKQKIDLADLTRFPMVVSAIGAPARLAFDRVFAAIGGPSASLLETGSMILMRELLRISDHIGCISRLQVAAELALGALVMLPVEMHETTRPIGLTLRRDWLPTRAQAEFLAELRTVTVDPT